MPGRAFAPLRLAVAPPGRFARSANSFSLPMMAKATATRSNPAAGSIPNARKAPYPDFIEASHPTARLNAPRGDQWVHEIKVDGYRCQLHVRQGAVKAFTRRGYDWSTRFRSVVDGAKKVRVREAIIDGEVIVSASEG